jgi:predicted ATPase
VLGKGRRTAVPRQQTLRATLDWSYELLSDEEQAVLRRLSVFAGAFTFDSAAAVCEDDRPGEPCEAIDDLVLKSLVVVDTGANLARYRLLEATRAYAFEKLSAAGELEAASRAHAQHVCHVFEQMDTASSLDDAAGHGRWMDDIQVAVQASFATLRDVGLGMRLLATTAPVWYERFLLDEYRQKAEMALQEARGLAEQPEETLMRLWHSLGHCYWHIKGPHPDVTRAFARAYEIAQRLQNADFERRALWGLWVVQAGLGHYAASLDLARKHTAVASPGVDVAVQIQGQHITQLSLHLMGDQAASREVATSTLGLLRRIGKRRPPCRFHLEPRSETNTVLARTLWIQGLPDQALSVAAEAVQSARSAQHDLTLCFALFGQCAVLMWCGRWADLGRQADVLLSVAVSRRLSYWTAWGQTFKDAHAYVANGVVVPRWQRPIVGAHQLELMATVSDEMLDAEALARAESGKAGWCAPELFRAQGTKLRREDASPREVEPWFARALNEARLSQALAWELRSATSLAQCWLSQDRRDDAVGLLSGVLARYTEGFDSVDVQRARQIVQAANA